MLHSVNEIKFQPIAIYFVALLTGRYIQIQASIFLILEKYIYIKKECQERKNHKRILNNVSEHQ